VSPRTLQRDERIRALRTEGQTLQQIADAVGVSRERVRQVLVRIGGPTASEVRAAAEAQRLATAADLTARIRQDVAAHPGSTREEIASRLGVGKSEVHAHLPEDLRPQVVNPAASSERVWSERDIMAALTAAATYSYPLSAGDYEALLRAGEIRGPSVARVAQLYGNWSAACVRAGVEATSPKRRNYQSKWTDADMLGFVRDYLSSPGCRGTFHGYDPWRRKTGFDAPSSALLRSRLGSWSEIKRKALEA
jgi:hypothetical protein